MHSIDLFHGANLTIIFSLRMSGSTFPMVLPFFTHMNPGFRENNFFEGFSLILF